MKFVVSTASTNYAPYATVHEKIATYIQKNYDCGHDIAKSIRTGQLVDLNAEKPFRAETLQGPSYCQKEGRMPPDPVWSGH